VPFCPDKDGCRYRNLPNGSQDGQEQKDQPVRNHEPVQRKAGHNGGDQNGKRSPYDFFHGHPPFIVSFSLVHTAYLYVRRMFWKVSETDNPASSEDRGVFWRT
jgi:hypothetical protein